MSDKALHVIQVMGFLTVGTALTIVGAIINNPLLLAAGMSVIGVASGNAAPSNLLSSVSNGGSRQASNSSTNLTPPGK